MRIAALLLVVGCSKAPTGTFTGDLIESCQLAKIGQVHDGTATVERSAGGKAMTNTTITIRKIGDGKLELTLGACTIQLDHDGDAHVAEVAPFQGCNDLAIGNYKGAVSISGQLSYRDDDIEMQLALNPKDKGYTGGCAYTLHGKRS
jgi:hypothetical protein